MDEFSDNALMNKVREGDLGKLGLLFERYKKTLFGFFHGIYQDRAVCEDLVQNVFYRILRYRRLFRGDGEFKMWMFSIARNISHDHFRKDHLKRKSDPIEDWTHALRVEDRFSEIKAEEERITLGMALERLAHDKREVLMLSKYSNKRYKEIGEILGCSEGAVKIKVFRALKDLKEIFQQLEKSR